MTLKGNIIGIFIKKNRILSFLETLKHKYGVGYDKIFVHEIDTNKYEYLVTFKVFDKEKYIKEIQGCSVRHVKNKCFFSINALNKLIETEKDNSNQPNNEYVIDWDNLKNKLIITSNNELSISNLTKIDDFCYFFK